MKRILVFALMPLIFICIITGCSGTQNGNSESSEAPIEALTEAPTEVSTEVFTEAPADTSSDESSPPPDKPETKIIPASSSAKVVDLTQLSSTMIYAEVYNMMMNPEDYVGRTIMLNGLYYASYNPDLDTYYHFVVIEDATACCAQGLEFIWNGEHAYPDDFPADETPIEISGIWGSYEEEGQTYFHIATDDIKVL